MLDLNEDDIKKSWKNNNVLLSISCICYNQAKYIEQTLDGFLMQKTNFAFEVLIHDDCSTDGTAEIIKSYEKKYPQIVKPMYEVVNQYSIGNTFVSKLNYKRALGKYIAFCEGDDYWVDDRKIQKQVDFLEKNKQYGMCYTNFKVFFQNENKYIENALESKTKWNKIEFSSLEEWVKNKGYTGPMTWVYRKELLSSFDDLSSIDGSFVMFAHFLHETKVKCLRDFVSSVYRINDGSVTHYKDLNKVLNREENLLITQKKLIEKYNLLININDLENEFYRKDFSLFIFTNRKDYVEKSIKFQRKLIYFLMYFIYKLPFGFKILSFMRKTLRNN